MAERHLLLFTDLFGSCSEETSKCSQQQTNLISTYFEREETKKSSFSLSNPVKLRNRSLAEGKETCDLTREDPQNTLHAAASGTRSVGKDTDHNIATASISCCVSLKGDCINVTPSNQVFLFGGFELIASISSVQVFVTRAGRTSDVGVKEAEEEYLTSCKGIPARDLPPLDQQSQTRTGNQISDANVQSWFKFVLASPGGAKPVYRVRLEFILPSIDQNAIIIRTLKVKCRLSDLGPTSSGITFQQSFTRNQLSGIENPAKGIRNNENLPSVMAIMGQSRSMATISQPQNTERVVSRLLAGMGGTLNTTSSMSINSSAPIGANMTSTHNTEPSTYPQHHLDQYHSEIISSITGLGMFLKISEEKTRNSVETMLTQMEYRIMEKLDTLSNRLSALENQISSIASFRSHAECNDDSYDDCKVIPCSNEET